jgi:hypothetical protein
VSTGCSTCKTRTSVFSCRIPTTTARSRSSANPESSTANRTLMTPLPSPAMADDPAPAHDICSIFCGIACRWDAFSDQGKCSSVASQVSNSPAQECQVTIAHERGPSVLAVPEIGHLLEKHPASIANCARHIGKLAPLISMQESCRMKARSQKKPKLLDHGGEKVEGEQN